MLHNKLSNFNMTIAIDESCTTLWPLDSLVKLGNDRKEKVYRCPFGNRWKTSTWGCSKMFICKARKKPNREAYMNIRWAVRFAAQHSRWQFFNCPTVPNLIQEDQHEHNFCNRKRQKNGPALRRMSGMHARKKATEGIRLLVCQEYRKRHMPILRGVWEGLREKGSWDLGKNWKQIFFLIPSSYQILKGWFTGHNTT